MDWQLIATAPSGRDLELAVIETDKVYPLVFPCSRTENGWLNSWTRELVSVRPTHWRFWGSRRRN